MSNAKNYIDKKLNESNLNEQLLIEHGFSRIAQIMSGLVPKIRTFAIITWENPMGKQLSPEENNKRNKDLKDLLIRGVYPFSQIKGVFDNIENPFFIHNITKEAAKQLGNSKEGNQRSIIWGEVIDKFDVIFHYIDFGTNEEDTRHIWKKLEQNKENYYSEYKGRKFQIPFFDDNYKNTKFKIIKGQGVYSENELKPEIIKEVEKRFNDGVLADSSYTGKHRWNCRGSIKNLLDVAING